MNSHRFKAHLFACSFAALTLLVPSVAAAQNASPTVVEILQGAEKVGNGQKLSVYRKDGRVFVSLSRESFDKPFIWYAEVVGLPAGAVSDSLVAGSLLARFERHGNLVVVRDLTTRATKTSVTAGEDVPAKTELTGDQIPGAIEEPSLHERPIDIALNLIDTGPVITSFSVAAEDAEGRVLVDVTSTFSNDIASLTARDLAALSGLTPAAVDPAGSYIDRVKATETTLSIRTHLTFQSLNPKNPVTGVRPVSVVVGHSLMFLPEKPMAWREADPRIGYISSKFTEYESGTGALVASRDVIHRFRLEKKDPTAAISDPVKPIMFYIGPGVPDRWRPYLKAGVELWNPAFEAAGFSNAISAVDAPTPQQDPDWSVEDINHNVVRWVATERVNALGPQVIDPRSGEVLAAHILIWPGVLDYFSRYYFALFGTVDPEANKLPFSTDKLGRLLTYIVAHEVGHTLGLRHNHIASTAHSVEQMRDAVFANAHGPNSSIMAYGRFNQVAQPNDGVTQLYSKLGPYDMAAIAWGYGQTGMVAEEERKSLGQLAAKFTADRELWWAAGEMPQEMAQYYHDPRVEKENTGAERIDATRLGTANILRSLTKLDEATGGDDKLFADAYDVMVGTHKGLLDSVSNLVGGAMPRIGKADGVHLDLVPPDQQSDAVDYLLIEGVRTLEPYTDPTISQRITFVGGEHGIEQLQADLLVKLLTGSRIAVLGSQSKGNDKAYSPTKFGHDVATAVWDNLEQATPTDRALQRAYIAQTKVLMAGWSTAAAKEPAETMAVIAAGFPVGFASIESDTGDDTDYPAWLRAYLPQLKTRLESAAQKAATESDRLHFGQMTTEIMRLIAQL